MNISNDACNDVNEHSTGRRIHSKFNVPAAMYLSRISPISLYSHFLSRLNVLLVYKSVIQMRERDGLGWERLRLFSKVFAHVRLRQIHWNPDDRHAAKSL